MIINNEKVIITSKVIEDIYKTIGRYSPETGGILGCENNGVITNYYFDYNKESTSYKYVMSSEHLNNYIESNWYPNGITFCGIIHSHPKKKPYFSEQDLKSAKLILKSIDKLKDLYLFLVLIEEDRVELNCYVARLDLYNNIECNRVIILERN